MMASCPSFSPDGPFVSDMLAHIDCQAQTIGAAGYHALASPGSAASVGLTALLTVFVALFGYRMLFGQVPSARDAVVAIVKVGIVLALATSWSAYRTVVYDVAMHGPAELAVSIGNASALPGVGVGAGAGGGLEAHLQAVDIGLAELVRIGTGRPPEFDEPVANDAQPLSPEQQQQRMRELGQRPRWDPQRDAEVLGTARTMYLTGAIGALAAVRLVAGFLLALGPFIALFLLFDATRGVFEGWVRALGGAALGSLATAILLGVELAILEPWLGAILAQRQADIPTPAVPAELLAFALVFALTLLAGLIAAAKIAQGFRIPVAVRDASTRLIEHLQTALAGARVETQNDNDRADPPERSRAQMIGDAAAAAQRRNLAAATQPMSGSRMNERGGNPQSPSRGPETVAVVPIGQSARRRIQSRVSAGSRRRDSV